MFVYSEVARAFFGQYDQNLLADDRLWHELARCIKKLVPQVNASTTIQDVGGQRDYSYYPIDEPQNFSEPSPNTSPTATPKNGIKAWFWRQRYGHAIAANKRFPGMYNDAQLLNMTRRGWYGFPATAPLMPSKRTIKLEQYATQMGYSRGTVIYRATCGYIGDTDELIVSDFQAHHDMGCRSFK